MRQLIQFSSVQFSPSVMSDSLRPHGPQYSRPPCPSPTPRVYSNSPPLSDATQLSHPLSSSSPPAFNLCQHQGLFKWVSSSHQVAKVLEFQLQMNEKFQLQMNIQDWFPLGWTGWISLLSKGWNTWKPMADSCQCMAKTTTILKIISLQLKINK